MSLHPIRIYINAADAPARYPVFYSRRGTGPCYRWLYDEEQKRWRSSRVRLDAPMRSLRSAHSRVPEALRNELLAHYED